MPQWPGDFGSHAKKNICAVDGAVIASVPFQSDRVGRWSCPLKNAENLRVSSHHFTELFSLA